MKTKTYKKNKKALDIYDEYAILDENVDEFLFGQDDNTILQSIDVRSDEGYD